MGKLLEAIARRRTETKLKRGRCLECGKVLPDVWPVPGYQACSEECANEVWAAGII